MNIAKRLSVIILAAVLLLTLCPAVSASGEAACDGYVIRLRDVTGAEELATAHGAVRCSSRIYVVDRQETVKKLTRLGVVECSGPNYVMTLQDAYQSEQWNLNAIDAQAAWNHKNSVDAYNCRGDGIIVAIIDSGVFEHQDLNTANFVDVPEQYQGCKSWHGTAVAGIIAAQLNGFDVDGIAPNVNIMSLCVTDESGKTSSSTVIAAMDYAIENGADVINISIGGTDRDLLLDDACRRACESGVIVVASAGNYVGNATRSATKYMYPASCGYAVSVSACKQSGDTVVFDDSYSFYNDAVTVCAPGTDILSLHPDNQLALNTGTSFASPTITAVAALAKQYDRNIGLSEFIDLLASSSTDLGSEGWDIYYGCGVVNIGRLIDKLEELYSEPAVPEDPEPQEETLPPEEGDPHPADEPENNPIEERPVSLPFADIETHWAKDAIGYAFRNGLMKGISDTEFQPNGTLSRAMLVVMLYRLAGEPAASGENVFSDIRTGDWYEQAVLWANENGIVNGVGNGTFLPSAQITREQMAAMLIRFSDYLGIRKETDADLSAFRDAPAISAWAANAMKWACACGLITGRTADTIVPQGTATRAEAATILMRFCEFFSL